MSRPSTLLLKYSPRQRFRNTVLARKCWVPEITERQYFGVGLVLSHLQHTTNSLAGLDTYSYTNPIRPASNKVHVCTLYANYCRRHNQQVMGIIISSLKIPSVMFQAIRTFEIDMTVSVLDRYDCLHVQGPGSNMKDITASSPGRH